ncbi:glycosyltransferase [Marinicella gelatinilytica]|uniref:glycosyltransferase n=1 Tax=Marinicella gelatinilytica TaxID=2996017 RepID=UPI0022608A51|nr:glycosyltransferase [Marinicella gelatinilytica]MCX7545088.1 glycosyltransferase [Marinicella gelatinilytica]
MQRSAALTVMQILPALNMGGVERGTVEFARYLKQQGHRAIVVSGGGYQVQALENTGVEHIQLPVGKKSPLTFRYVPTLRKIFKQYNVDIVHARSRLPAWLCYFALRKKPRPPYFVTTLHGLHSVSRYSSVMARGDAVVAVSKTAADYLQQNFKKHLKTQPQVIYRGVDFKVFKFGYQADKQWVAALEARHPALKNSQKVLLPGRLTAVKGFENIMPWLGQSGANQYLLVTADSNQTDYTKRLFESLKQAGLSEKVIWIGPQQRMADLYAYVDLTLSINRKPESFGRTVLESLTVGTPVVGLNHGGVGEILTALFPSGLVPVGDDDRLIRWIKAMLLKPAVMASQTQFSNQQQFQQTVALYQQLLAQKS